MPVIPILLLIQSLNIQTCSKANIEQPKANLQFTFSYPVHYSHKGKKVTQFSYQDTVTVFYTDNFRIMRLPYQH